MADKRGFTLLEILLVVAAIGILAGIVIVAINPGKQLATTRNTTRRADVGTLSNAFYQYAIDHGSRFPSGIDTTLRMIGTSASGCNVNCGSTGSAPSGSPFNVGDSSQNKFAGATFSNTQYSVSNSWVSLASGASGSLTSSIKDAGGAAPAWTSLAWIPQFPSGKELPGNGGKETGYPSGNADMSGNILLMHLNEGAGTTSFTDASGKNNAGSCSGTACPTATTGRFNGAFNFDKTNDVITIPYSSQLDTGTGDFSFSVFFLTGGGPNNGLLKKGAGPFNLKSKGWEIRIRGETTNPSIEFSIGDGASYTRMPGAGYPVDRWNNVIIVVSRSSGQSLMYLNGALSRSISLPPTYSDNFPLEIGHGTDGFWSGIIDEIAIFNRALSATEISDIYKRGAARLKLQARSCTDATCVGSTFTGPDGTSGTYFTELTNTGLTPPSISIVSLPSNRYMQYKAFFETDHASSSPALTSVTASGSVVPTAPASTPGIGPTADACIDVSSSLVSDYLAAIPADPSGNPAKTSYAVQQTEDGRLTVSACSAELGVKIQATK